MLSGYHNSKEMLSAGDPENELILFLSFAASLSLAIIGAYFCTGNEPGHLEPLPLLSASVFFYAFTEHRGYTIRGLPRWRFYIDLMKIAFELVLLSELLKIMAMG